MRPPLSRRTYLLATLEPPYAAPRVKIVGVFPLAALAHGLHRFAQLMYPPTRASTPTWWNGDYTLRGIARTIERETAAQCHIRGNRLRIDYPKSHNFTLWTKPITSQKTLDGITVTTLGDYQILTGPIAKLPLAESIIRRMKSPPQTAQLTLLICADDNNHNLSLSIGPTSGTINLNDLGSLAGNIQLQINALLSTSTIYEKWIGTITAGQDTTFSDQTERVASGYTAIASNASTATSQFQTGFTSRTAGLTITVKPTVTGRTWTIDGKITDSQFTQPGILSDETIAETAFDQRIKLGELQHVLTYTLRSDAGDAGIQQTQLTAAKNPTQEEYTVWIWLQPLPTRQLIIPPKLPPRRKNRPRLPQHRHQHLHRHHHKLPLQKDANAKSGSRPGVSPSSSIAPSPPSRRSEPTGSAHHAIQSRPLSTAETSKSPKDSATHPSAGSSSNGRTIPDRVNSPSPKRSDTIPSSRPGPEANSG
jgi:hypothetical protein